MKWKYLPYGTLALGITMCFVISGFAPEWGLSIMILVTLIATISGYYANTDKGQHKVW